MTEEYAKGYQAGLADAEVHWQTRLQQFVVWLKSIELGEYATTHKDYAMAIRGVVVRLAKTGIAR